MSRNESSNELTPEKIGTYCINLMWVNDSFDRDGPTVAANKDEGGFREQIIEPAIKWALVNPEAQIYLWFDSAHTTKQAMISSYKILQSELDKSGVSAESGRVKLRDIRSIPDVAYNGDIFTPNLPVYFRVDLLKLMIILHTIEHERFDASIFSDLEIGDIKKDEGKNLRWDKAALFNPDVCKDLDEFGFIQGHDDRNTENQFLQLYKKPYILDAIRFCIHSHLNRATNCLQAWCEEGESSQKGIHATQRLVQSVFQYMSGEIKLFFALLEHGAKISLYLDDKTFKCSEEDDSKTRDYDPLTDGYNPWGKYEKNILCDVRAIKYSPQQVDGNKYVLMHNFGSGEMDLLKKVAWQVKGLEFFLRREENCWLPFYMKVITTNEAKILIDLLKNKVCDKTLEAEKGEMIIEKLGETTQNAIHVMEKIPVRATREIARPGNGHTISRYVKSLTPMPPQNGKSYEAFYSRYCTDRALKMLNLSSSAKQSSQFFRFPAAQSAEVDVELFLSRLGAFCKKYNRLMSNQDTVINKVISFFFSSGNVEDDNSVSGEAISRVHSLAKYLHNYLLLYQDDNFDLSNLTCYVNEQLDGSDWREIDKITDALGDESLRVYFEAAHDLIGEKHSRLEVK